MKKHKPVDKKKLKANKALITEISERDLSDASGGDSNHTDPAPIVIGG